MDKFDALDWETVFTRGGSGIKRAKVVGGWLVDYGVSGGEDSPSGLTFIPDPEYKWEIIGNLSQSDDPKERIKAAKELRDPEMLGKLLADSDPSVVVAAAKSIADTGYEVPDNPEDWPPTNGLVHISMAASLGGQEPEKEVQDAVSGTLAKLGYDIFGLSLKDLRNFISKNSTEGRDGKISDVYARYAKNAENEGWNEPGSERARILKILLIAKIYRTK